MAADFDQAFAYTLTHTAGIQAVLGTRIYPIALPQTVTLPAAVYQPVGGSPIRVHREKTLLPSVNMQVTVFAEDLDDARSGEKAITTALDGFRGTMGTGATATEVQECTASKVPIYGRDPETLLYTVIREFFIMWKE
jgi:hypothetical protein